VAGSATLLLVALTVGPIVFHRHIEDALGFVPETVQTHLDEAFGEALGVSLAVAVTAATVTAAGVGWLVSTRIARPVRALAAAARRVSRGDYDARLQLAGDDELAVLGRAFNDMAGTLASAEARRRRLLSDVAHELRTPLATIDAHLEGLADGVLAPEDATWGVLRAETARLRRLSEDIARVSRAEEHQLDLRVVRVAPHELLEAAARAHRPAYDAGHVELEVSVEGRLAPVEVDPERAREVLAILLDNALRHTPPGGRVTLSARGVGTDVVLAVEDSGEGLDKGGAGARLRTLLSRRPLAQPRARRKRNRPDDRARDHRGARRAPVGAERRARPRQPLPHAAPSCRLAPLGPALMMHPGRAAPASRSRCRTVRGGPANRSLAPLRACEIGQHQI